MSNNNLVVAIDIGSYKIRTVVAMVGKDKDCPHVLGMGTSFSNGIRKGNVVSIKDLIDDINMSIEEAETVSGMPVQSVFISIGNGQIESIPSRGVIAVPGKEITESDVERALEASQTISFPQNKYILDVIPRSYRIDNNGDIRNPVGMNGIRLEVDSQIVTTSEQSLKNLEKSVNQVGVEVMRVIPSILASSEAALTRRQKELGVVLIDIGSCSTGIAVYEEGVVLYVGSIPVGGENVTNDVAIGLRTSIETAEKIKIEYGTVNKESVSEREQIDLSLLSTIDTDRVSRKELSNIMKARYEEIFYMVKNELKQIKRDGMLPAGAVLIGGGSKVPGVLEMCKDMLSLPAQIGFPQGITSAVDKIDDPEYATAIGLIRYGEKYDGQTSNYSFNFLGNFDWLVKGFKNLLPN